MTEKVDPGPYNLPECKPDQVVTITVPYPTNTQNGPTHVAMLTAARKWWQVSRLWFSSEERLKARAYAATTVVLSLLTTLLLLQISSVQSDFNSALSEKQPAEFYQAVRSFIRIILVAAPLFALNEYVDSRIAIEWRSWMARRLIASYLGNRAYFRLKVSSWEGVDNPDERICDDVRSFTGSSVVLAIGILRQLFYCVAFSGLLASLAPRLVIFLLLYAAAGTWITAAGFGRRLTVLAFSALQKEADLRFDLVRVRENAESVAFYGADAREARIASGRLATAVGVSRSQATLQAWLSLWQNIYGYATILAPSLLMAPKYFAGEVRFGTITQVSFAFNRIEAALTYFVNNLAQLSNLAAETERLEALLTALGSPAPTGNGVESKGGGGEGGIHRIQAGDAQNPLELQNLTVYTPHGERILFRELSLSLPHGQSMLVVGPSGCGKSSLLRAISGLWNSGSGTIRTPAASSLFFLPQKPYMPLGTLRQQLCFPDDPDWSPHEAATLAGLLDSVCLPDLLQRLGGLDVECDWAHVLSLGEQQRIGFLRLLRRRPTVAFLDEATSGVDSKTETVLYRALHAVCSCIVSVGHRKELLNHHTLVVEAVGEGRWVLQTVAAFRENAGM